MANAFKNAYQDVTSTATTIYTVPSATEAVIQSIRITNIDGTNAVDATVEISNDNGSTYYKIASTISVPADSTLDLISRPIYLDETDLIAVTAGAANDLAYHVSYVEMVD